MGLTISNFFGRFFNKRQGRILMLGLDSAGKTTTLYKLKLGEVVSTVPTIGFNIETVACKNIYFTVWDVGGQEKIRRLWIHYCPNTDGIIYVIDSSDRDRILEAAKELNDLLEINELKGIPLLILLNKNDLPESITPEELKGWLVLERYLQDRPWHIQPSSNLKGTGLHEGFDWLAQEFKKKKFPKNINNE